MVLCLLLWVPFHRTSADIVIYRQGGNNGFATNYAGTSDTQLFSSAPDANYGSGLGWSFSPSDSTGLLRFNLTSFAGQYAQITGVTLTLHAASGTTITTEGDLSAYVVSTANAGWVAGTGSGSTQTGSSTWNRRIHNTVNWAGSAGLSTAGTDFNATPLATVHWVTLADYTLNFSGTPAQLKALVDQWSGTQSANAGILLRNVITQGAGSISFLTANTTLPQYSPKLTITYTTGPAVIVEQPAGTVLVNGTSTIDFGAAAGTKAFTVRNDGQTTLNSIAPFVTGGNSGDFVVGAPGAVSLAPGASNTFDVTFTPGGASTRTTTLRITSNDTSASPFSVNLTGTGWTSLQSWRNQYFQTLNNTGNAADNADPDGDGLVNVLEYALGLNPKAYDAESPLKLQIDSEGVMTLMFKRARPAAEVTYTLRVSQALSDWSDYAVNPGTVGQDAVLTENVTAILTRFFYLNIQVHP